MSSDNNSKTESSVRLNPDKSKQTPSGKKKKSVTPNEKSTNKPSPFDDFVADLPFDGNKSDTNTAVPPGETHAPVAAPKTDGATMTNFPRFIDVDDDDDDFSDLLSDDDDWDAVDNEAVRNKTLELSLARLNKVASAVTLPVPSGTPSAGTSNDNAVDESAKTLVRGKKIKNKETDKSGKTLTGNCNRRKATLDTGEDDLTNVKSPSLSSSLAGERTAAGPKTAAEKISRLMSKPVDISQTSLRLPTPEYPVLHHSEGTQEVFVSSKLFDALLDGKDTPNPATANTVAIVSTGQLPAKPDKKTTETPDEKPAETDNKPGKKNDEKPAETDNKPGKKADEKPAETDEKPAETDNKPGDNKPLSKPIVKPIAISDEKPLNKADKKTPAIEDLVKTIPETKSASAEDMSETKPETKSASAEDMSETKPETKSPAKSETAQPQFPKKTPPTNKKTSSDLIDHANDYQGDSIEISQDALKKSSKNEVFASRLPGKATGSKAVSQSQSYGLPKVNVDAMLHPEGKETSQSPADKRYLVDHLYPARLTSLLGMDADDLGAITNTEFFLEKLYDASEASTPLVVSFRYHHEIEFARCMRQFLSACIEHVPSFHGYGTISGHESSCDIVTSLVSSRVGCLPENSEKEKHDKLYRVSQSLFSKSDLHWGLDVLSVRYDVPALLTAKTQLPNLRARNDIDMAEVLTSIIAHDAATGPVAIVLTRAFMTLAQPFIDIIRRIQNIPASNILLIIPQTIGEKLIPGAIETYPSEISEQERREILSHVLDEYGGTQEQVDLLIKKTGSSFMDIRRTLSILRENLLRQSQDTLDLTGLISSLPETEDERASEYCTAFSPDSIKFLNYASALNDVFYLEDLETILHLEPLEGEIPFFEDKRHEWCIRNASYLLETGELIRIDTRRYTVPEQVILAGLFEQLEPEKVRQIRGTYARLLEHRTRSQIRIAEAYEKAGMWENASMFWMHTILALEKSTCCRSAYNLLRHCMEHTGPMNGAIYVQQLQKAIDLSKWLGKFDEAEWYASTLSRTCYVNRDRQGTCNAFIQLGNVLRLKGEYERAETYLKYALEIAEKEPGEVLRADAEYAMGELIFCAGGKGAFVTSLRNALKSLEIRRHLNDLAGVAQSQLLCAKIYLLRGEPSRAKQAASEAFHALTVSGNWTQTPLALMLQTESAAALGETIPLENIEKGLDIARKIGNINQQFYLLCASIRLTMNSLHRPAIREELLQLERILTRWPYAPWFTEYLLLATKSEFINKNFSRAAKLLKKYISTADSLGNPYLIGLGYGLSAELNFEVYKASLGVVALDKTEKLFNNAIAIFESSGVWHNAADMLRKYAVFLEHLHRDAEAAKIRQRADKVDPYQ